MSDFAIVYPTQHLTVGEGALVVTGTGTPGAPLRLVLWKEGRQSEPIKGHIGRDGRWSEEFFLLPGAYALHARSDTIRVPQVPMEDIALPPDVIVLFSVGIKE